MIDDEKPQKPSFLQFNSLTLVYTPLALEGGNFHSIPARLTNNKPHPSGGSGSGDDRVFTFYDL